MYTRIIASKEGLKINDRPGYYSRLKLRNSVKLMSVGTSKGVKPQQNSVDIWTIEHNNIFWNRTVIYIQNRTVCASRYSIPSY